MLTCMLSVLQSGVKESFDKHSDTVEHTRRHNDLVMRTSSEEDYGYGQEKGG